MSAHIIATFCFKGGVGKTTLAILLAHGLAHHGKNVLVIDLDETPVASEALIGREALAREIPEQNRASAYFGRLMQQQQISEVSYIRSHIPTLKAAPRSADPQVSLLPGSERLSEEEDKIIAELIRDHRVAANSDAFELAQQAASRGIRQCARHFDYVIVDCPPHSTRYCVGALDCADLVLLPYIADEVSFGRVQRTARLIEQVNSDEELTAIPQENRRYIAIANQVQSGRSSHHRSNIENVNRTHPHFDWFIKDHPRLTAALKRETSPLTLSQKYAGGVKIINQLVGDVDGWLQKRRQRQ